MAAGRPRAFDSDKALDKAIDVFWKKGFEGASLPDLTKAMGINRPSLYAAFGNKEELFRKALNRYTSKQACFVNEAMSQPTARAAAEKVLRGVVDALSCPKSPGGCLLVQTAITCGDDAKRIRKTMIAERAGIEIALRKRFEQAKAAGDFPLKANPADLARYLAAVTQGMSIHAADGATREELITIAELAMNAWPA